MSEHLSFPNWTAVRTALQAAYDKLGLKMQEVKPGLSQYDPIHWNIAGLVREHVLSNSVKCVHCQEAVTVHTVIRCFDCKAPLCERCAPEHFGPKHQARADLAHPKT